MAQIDVRRALRAARGADPASVPDIVATAAAELGGTDVVLYLIDFAQTTLAPLPDRRAHADLPASEEVATSMAGRAFLDEQPVIADRVDGSRVWVPVFEGSDRTGVLAVTVPRADVDVVDACADLALLTGYLIATHARNTDLYNLHRRRESLSLAASMQWDVLPPLVLKTDGVAVAGLLEPAYEVAGDSFDYALNGETLDLAVMDAMGHGIDSALLAALAIGSYRHDRREGRSLPTMHANLDAAVGDRYDGAAFLTGHLVRLELDSGALTWTCAGHPPPLLVRGRRVVAELISPPSPPWGLGSLLATPALPLGPPPTVGAIGLEPDDSVLFYTDGVVESHSPGGELFGIQRLSDLVERHATAGLRPEDIVRRVTRSVLEHQEGPLADDATLVLLQWRGRGTR
jgi:serine phosphatase RsbU (regulator of sigma subunit)